MILQSNNDHEFLNKIIQYLKELMQGTLKIVHGNPSHTQCQVSARRANYDYMLNILIIWMKANNCKLWLEGLNLYS